MIIGVLAAVVSALGYGIASVLQAKAARAQPDAAGVDARLLVRLARSGPFMLGIVLDAIGFAAQFVALRSLAVYVVQAVQAGNLAVTAVVAIPVLGLRLAGREWGAVGAVCVGLVLLAAAAGTDHPNEVGAAVRWSMLAAAVVVTALGYVVGHRGGRRVPVALGFIAGLGFGVVALAARVLTDLSWGPLASNPATYALALAGVASFLLYATALQRGVVTTVTAAVIIGETLLPAIVGIVVLGDRPRPGLAWLAVVGWLIAIAGALMLARFGELDDEEGAGPTASRVAAAGADGGGERTILGP